MEVIKVLMIFSTVIITLITAILLNYGAKESTLFSITGIIIVVSVLVINFIKFKTWGILYKRYHLNETYPLVALFFPLIYLVAVFQGEAIIEMKKMLGITFIFIGVWMISKRKEDLI